MKKILIAGTNSGVGKTTISLGIMQALTKRNLKVQPFKVGPDYIDPSYHTFITGRYSRNLDSYMLEDEKIKYIVKEASKDADISVIEGVMGLYDGYGIDLDDCTSSYTSKMLKAPVILVINAKAMATSAAAMVLGYKMLDKNVNIAGVITNNVKSESHYNILKEAIETYTGVEVLGYFPPNKEFSLESRHLGLIPSVEMDSLKAKFDNLAEEIEKYINIDGEKDVHLEKVREYIEIYPENIFSIDEMADSAFSSKYNFIRRFKERTGLTPHQFQIQNRIRKAQKLLEKLSITTEVALTTGFYDQSHFIRNFKKIVKMTPLEFQSSIKRINLFKEELE